MLGSRLKSTVLVLLLSECYTFALAHDGMLCAARGQAWSRAHSATTSTALTDGLASDTPSMHVLWTHGLSFVLVPYRMVSDTLSLSCRSVRCPAFPPFCGFFHHLRASLAPTARQTVYDEVEIEEMEWNVELNAFTWSCPCGDIFRLTVAEMRAGEEIATCPSCTLILRVIYDDGDIPEEVEAGGGVPPTPPAVGVVA